MKMRGALEREANGVDVPVLDRHRRAHRLQALDVQVDGPLADGAARREARRAPLRSAPVNGPSARIEARIVFTRSYGRVGFRDLRGVEVDAVEPDVGLHAHALQERDHRAHVVQLAARSRCVRARP
jgi:hypothetical protein